MEEIIKGCKNYIIALFAFSAAIFLMLISDKDWKFYTDSYEYFEKISQIDFRGWRDGVLFRKDKDMEIYLDSIEKITKSILTQPSNTPNSQSKINFQTSTETRNKNSQRFYLEELPLKEFLKSASRSLSKFTPNLKTLPDSLHLLARRANLIKKREQFAYGPIFESIQMDLDYFADIFRLRVYFYFKTKKGDTANYVEGPIEIRGTSVLDYYARIQDTIDKIADDSTLEAKFESDNNYNDLFLALRDKKISEALDYIKTQRDKKKAKVSLLGLEFDNDIIVIFAPCIYFIIYSIILIMLIDLWSYLRLEKSEKKYFYWILIKNNLVGRITSFFSFMLPIAVLSWLVFRYWSFQTKISIWLISVLMIFIFSLSILNFIFIQKIRRIYPAI